MKFKKKDRKDHILKAFFVVKLQHYSKNHIYGLLEFESNKINV